MNDKINFTDSEMLLLGLISTLMQRLKKKGIFTMAELHDIQDMARLSAEIKLGHKIQEDWTK